MSPDARSFTSDQLMYAARAARLNLPADRRAGPERNLCAHRHVGRFPSR